MDALPAGVSTRRRSCSPGLTSGRRGREFKSPPPDRMQRAWSQALSARLDTVARRGRTASIARPSRADPGKHLARELARCRSPVMDADRILGVVTSMGFGGAHAGAWRPRLDRALRMWTTPDTYPAAADSPLSPSDLREVYSRSNSGLLETRPALQQVGPWVLRPASPGVIGPSSSPLWSARSLRGTPDLDCEL
jgi:hypothetical protein